MKKYFLLIAMLAICLPAIQAFSQSDTSCLKREGTVPYWPDFNPDSVMVDSCANSPYYLQHYAKQYFSIVFNNNILPRSSTQAMSLIITPAAPPSSWEPDTTLVYSWHQIDSSKYPLQKQNFKSLEEKYGNFKILDGRLWIPDTETRWLLLVFENYVNIDSTVSYMRQFYNLDDPISSTNYTVRYGIFFGVDENATGNQYTVYPQPAADVINIKFPESSTLSGTAEIYSLEGIFISGVSISAGETSTQIDTKNLSNGVYYIRINNTVKPFVIVK